MKKIIIGCLLAVIATGAQAQLREIMKNKANQVVRGGSSNPSTTQESSNSPTADTTRPNTPTAVTPAGGNNTGVSQGGNAQNNGSQRPVPMYLGSGNKSDISSEYTYEHNVHIKLVYTGAKEKKSDTRNMIMYINEKTEYFGMEMSLDENKPEEKALMVYEYGKKQTVTYMTRDGKKNVMVSKYNETPVDTAAAAKNRVDFKKTGQTKTILGYSCEEWTGNDQEGNNYVLWVTKDASLPVSQYMKQVADAQKKRSRESHSDYTNYPQGMMMEMTSTNKDGDKTLWQVTAINMNKPFTVKTSDYEYVGF